MEKFKKGRTPPSIRGYKSISEKEFATFAKIQADRNRKRMLKENEEAWQKELEAIKAKYEASKKK